MKNFFLTFIILAYYSQILGQSIETVFESEVCCPLKSEYAIAFQEVGLETVVFHRSGRIDSLGSNQQNKILLNNGFYLVDGQLIQTDNFPFSDGVEFKNGNFESQYFEQEGDELLYIRDEEAFLTNLVTGITHSLGKGMYPWFANSQHIYLASDESDDYFLFDRTTLATMKVALGRLSSQSFINKYFIVEDSFEEGCVLVWDYKLNPVATEEQRYLDYYAEDDILVLMSRSACIIYHKNQKFEIPLRASSCRRFNEKYLHISTSGRDYLLDIDNGFKIFTAADDIQATGFFDLEKKGSKSYRLDDCIYLLEKDKFSDCVPIKFPRYEYYTDDRILFYHDYYRFVVHDEKGEALHENPFKSKPIFTSIGSESYFVVQDTNCYEILDYNLLSFGVHKIPAYHKEQYYNCYSFERGGPGIPKSYISLLSLASRKKLCKDMPFIERAFLKKNYSKSRLVGPDLVPLTPWCGSLYKIGVSDYYYVNELGPGTRKIVQYISASK